ncbi:MFS transporter [Clostridium thailandense]|uniref:MFS transporter n=1 Tax=Clostridium thailandense TaxID=2794346 RepID=UPI003989DB02
MEQNNLGGLGTKPTQKRWFVLFLVCLITFVNYLDRANLAVAAPFLSKDLRLNAAMMGVIFSAMGWSYTIMQIPCGWLLDRFGPRLIYGVALVGWSLITTAISISSGFRSMIAFRLGLGFFEAPAFPANNRIVTAWNLCSCFSICFFYGTSRSIFLHIYYRKTFTYCNS